MNTTQYFYNKQVLDFDPQKGIESLDVVYKLRMEWESKYKGLEELIGLFCADPKAAEVEELIIGAWSLESESSDKTVAALAEQASKMPQLKALYFGDIEQEESELSWIENSNVSSILKAFPKLEHFQVRGGNSLTFGKGLQSEQLKSLIVETGGMDKAILAEIAAADLPNLELLELWLGTEDYGWDGSLADVQPFLSKDLFPQLQFLGLKNSDISDDIAIALQGASVLDIITTLDLSMGTLSDKGGVALLNNEAIKGLNYLNLRHHYMSAEMMAHLQRLGIKVNTDEQEAIDEYDGEIYRYVEIGE